MLPPPSDAGGELFCDIGFSADNHYDKAWVAQLIEDAVRLAKSDPKPQAADLLSDVYVAYP